MVCVRARGWSVTKISGELKPKSLQECGEPVKRSLYDVKKY